MPKKIQVAQAMSSDNPYVIDDAELKRVLAAQPLAQMRRLASLLGWNGLCLWHFRVHKSDPYCDRVAGGAIIYYMTTDEKFNLQINVQPHGQTRIHSATVKAERYGIINVDWHEFELPEIDQDLLRLAERLKPFLLRGNFKNRCWRRKFAEAHPLLVYPNLKARRNRGLPPRFGC